MSSFYAEDLARIHHEAFGSLARAAIPAILGLLREGGIRGGTVVDLGCGSGLLLAALGRAGHHAVGVDLSSAMLRLARRTAPRAVLRKGSAFTARLPACDAVTATGEALGYLASSGAAPPLATLFRRVRRALRPGGLFVFDLLVASRGEPMSYRAWWTGPDWAVLVQVREDRRRRTLTRDITTFAARGRGYRRTSERHRVRVPERAQVLDALTAAGFSVRAAGGYGKKPLGPRRVVFIARAVAPLSA